MVASVRLPSGWAGNMRRRDFIGGIGATAAWPLAALGQSSRIAVVGILSPESSSTGDIEGAQPEAFAQGLMRDGRSAAICGSKIALAAAMVISIADTRANSPRFADKYGSSR